jgi:hypothetical protein
MPDLAQVAYEAYEASLAKHDFPEAETWAWTDLRQDVKDAWAAAVLAVVQVQAQGQG